MITFKIAPHTVLADVEVVEVFYNGQLIATIYPQPGTPGISIISKYEKLYGIRDELTNTIDFNLAKNYREIPTS